MKLVDADALVVEVKDRAAISSSVLFEGGLLESIEIINAHPATTVATVAHGRWIEKIETTRTIEEVDVQTSIECSVCGRRYWDTPGYDIDNGEYPPSCLCGARMDAQEGAEHAKL